MAHTRRTKRQRPITTGERAAMERARTEYALFLARGCSPEAMAQHEAFVKTSPGNPQGRLDLKVAS